MTGRPGGHSRDGGTALPGFTDPAELPVEDVAEVFTTLQKALRAFQLYDPNNPVYKKFVTNSKDVLQRVWHSVEKLHVLVEENRLVWLGEEVYRNESRTDSLAFLFYKDGIRDLTLLPGLEETELEILLGVLHRARNVRQDGEDLVTILWDQDLQRFRYTYLDYLADSPDFPSGGDPGERDGFDALLKSELTAIPEEDEAQEGGEDGAPAPAAGTVRREDFNPTLYSLDPKEQAYLQEALRNELERDLRDDVLSALFDRVEDAGEVERQLEILEILRTLLPNLLSHGALRPAARIVEELLAIRSEPGVLDPSGGEKVEQLIEDLSSEEVVGELVRSLEDGAIPPRAEELTDLFRFLRMSALPPLLRSAATAEDEEVAEVLRETVAAIAERHPEGLLRALGSSNPLVAAGAARVAGAIGLQAAATPLAQLLGSDSDAVRKAVIVAGRSIPSSVLANAIQAALDDPSREIRIEAARSLGAIEYSPAASRFREIIGGKSIREADITEKIAFFETFGQLGGSSAVQILDKILNGRSFLGRREPDELRAAAALALGKATVPEATSSLERASSADEPVVRSAVRRALRRED